MISESLEYKKMISNRLDENMKSFNLLFDLKHYGNCISIMCQELDQIVRLLYLINISPDYRKQLISSSINNQKWHITHVDNQKEYITDEILLDFSKMLNGWEKSIIEFGYLFKSISVNYNYGLRDPIKSMTDPDRLKLYVYIQEYHSSSFPKQFSTDEIIPILPMIMKLIGENMNNYLSKI
jgi:hypothetical protein